MTASLKNACRSGTWVRRLRRRGPTGCLVDERTTATLENLVASATWADSALGDRQVIPPRRAGVELARAADLLRRILDHLLPLRDPADRAGECEQHREHRGREAHRLERNARIEVDVRIELLLDEVLVLEGVLLGLDRHVEKRVVLDPELVQDLVRGLLHDAGPRVVVLVDPVPEAHQAEGV